MGHPSESQGLLSLPPLSLYVHLPWCVKKCPYCDFNSHALNGDVPASEYIDALLADLENDLSLVWGRVVHSVFFGGGTPSLFSASQIDTFLSGVRSRLQIAPAAEITLEANPGTIEYDSFRAYREAGINRVSLGVQSFNDASLKKIGRIHGSEEVFRAITSIRDAGLEDFNIDLMFGLPGQTLEQAVMDVELAMEQQPAHLSHYQLTLEPNTAFHANPPLMPGEDNCWEMQEACSNLLTEQGFEQYEISAWAHPGKRCVHNLNYWHYGDYLGIGAGAHSKLSFPVSGEVRRLAKQRHPKAYFRAMQDGNWRSEDLVVSDKDRCFEFFLNQLRLRAGVDMSEFGPRTGLSGKTAVAAVSEAQSRGLLEQQEQMLVPTELGWRFINEIQALFLPV